MYMFFRKFAYVLNEWSQYKARSNTFVFSISQTKYVNGRVVLSTIFTNREKLQNDLSNSMLRKARQKLSQHILLTPSLLEKFSYNGRTKIVLSSF